MDALNLPNWEFRDLIEQYHRLKAEDALTSLYTACYGFSGGDGAEAFERSLKSRAYPIEEEPDLPENVTLPQLLGINLPAFNPAKK